jgi:glycosyltransferase involved in cell wall biosynthesis
MHPSTAREAVRQRLGVQGHERLIGFFGRYHPHKGFDVFCEVAALAHQRGRHALKFISAGDGWVQPPGLPNYANLGWLGPDLADVLNAVDCLLQPNRHTFLDLIFIEAMSVGRPIVTTAVGGGRWLASVAKGVVAVELNPRPLLDAVESAVLEATRVELGRVNRDTYDATFTLRAFAERHIAFARAVLDGA